MKKKFSRAFTIEYAIVLMVIVIAFTGLLLTLAMVTNNYSRAYEEYLEYKRDLDSLGEAFLGGESIEDLKQSASSLLTQHDLSIDDTQAFTLVVRHGENGAVALTVQLSADGTLLKYIYGAA